MAEGIDPDALRAFWRQRREIALFDLRDEGRYSEAHPFFAVSLPVAQIESRIEALAPRKSAPIVVYDDGEGLTKRGAQRIEALGYSDVRILEGGLAAYARRGEVFRDVNVPSKAFGELVEAIRHTPSLSAEEAKTILETRKDVVVLDARRFEEYRTMSIPRGVSVPGAELALRVHDLAPSPDTLVIVNCAGRTRSIIGAQSLVNAGIPNSVAALRNGTIGWTLAGLALDHGRTERFGALSDVGRDKARARARAWAERVGVGVVDKAALDRFCAEREARALYCFDVRTPEEFLAGRPSGFVSAPGGQLVQATDEWVAVRGARIVLFDDDGVRARMTASWLVQMGWQAVVVEDEGLALDENGPPGPMRSPPRAVGAAALAPAEASKLDGAFVDLSPSPVYRKAHAPGAWFVSGSRLKQDLANVPGDGPLILFSSDGALAADNLSDVRAATTRSVHLVAGGLEAWAAHGLPFETEPFNWASEPDDVYKRPYEGTDNARAAMQAYIDWELQLVAQLANDGVSNFRVVR
jgi:rhodanese-related sulfurtransferase